MQSAGLAALVAAMKEGGGSRAETFFISQGLGAAYNSVGKGYGTQKRVNAALLQAEREDRQDEVVRAGLTEYGLMDFRESERRVPSGTSEKVGSTSRLFISHASADGPLADAVTDLLRLGTDLPSDRIMCTSVEGMGISAGTQDYLEALRREISDAGLVLALLTPAFFDSDMCLIEIGAMWGLGKSAFPLVVPPVDYGRVERLLGKVQGARIDQQEGLSELHDRILEVFGLSANTPRWNKKREQFQAQLPDLLAGLATSTRMDAAAIELTLSERAADQAELRMLRKEVGDLNEQIAQTTNKTEELQAALSLAQSELAAARSELERVSREPDPRDVDLFTRFLAELGPTSSTLDWSRNHFIPNHAPRAPIDELENWCTDWSQNPLAKFIDAEIDLKRDALVTAACAFCNVFGDLFWEDDAKQPRLSVPSEWKGEQPERYRAAIAEVTEKRNAWLRAYDEFVGIAHVRIRR